MQRVPQRLNLLTKGNNGEKENIVYIYYGGVKRRRMEKGEIVAIQTIISYPQTKETVEHMLSTVKK